jgi:hypothetical protein
VSPKFIVSLKFSPGSKLALQTLPAPGLGKECLELALALLEAAAQPVESARIDETLGGVAQGRGDRPLLAASSTASTMCW